MRDILFRGKRKDNGLWVYGDLRQYSETHKGIYDYDLRQTVKGIIPATVGQYTGVTDTNGKKIFEGDIIKTSIYYDIGCYPLEKTEVREVKYIDGCFIPLYSNNRKNTEVIGNIHDNPELLN